MIIGVTGTVGSGKSGVATMLAGSLQCPLVDTDAICRRLLASGQPAWQELKKRWPGFFTHKGELDRVRLREAVFTDHQVRLGLEEILHPLVRLEVGDKITWVREAGSDLLVEVPLLFEVGWQNDVDYVISVYAPEELSVVRVGRRDRVSSDQVRAILGAQLPAGEKARRADWVVDNSGLWASSFLQVAHLTKLLRLSSQPGKTRRKRT